MAELQDDVIAEQLSFHALDGWELAGTLYRAPDPKITILISAGTGFPRQFYQPIASYYAARGATVLTYDYRGIGDSNTDKHGFYNIKYPDWGRFDMPAALEALLANSSGLPVAHLAHSVGGHFIGLMPNHSKITRHAFVSVGTGYFLGHQLRNIPMELYFWWLLGPYLLRRYGYIKKAGGWQGQPLPPGVFKTWRRWCHQKSYFQSDFANAKTPESYNDITSPIRSWIFPDDPIATASASRDLLSCYPSAPRETIVRSPNEIKVKRIGHEGAFRNGRELLWDEFWDWFLMDD